MAAPTATATLPPGPRLPRALQTLAFIFAAPKFFDWCRRRYGDVVTMGTVFDSAFVMVFDPDIVKEVFRGPHERLRAGEANALLGPVLGTRSVLLLDGAEHMRQRKLMLPPFHGKRMRQYGDAIAQVAERHLAGWPRGRAFPVLPRMQAITLEVIMRAVFGLEDPSSQAQLAA